LGGSDKEGDDYLQSGGSFEVLPGNHALGGKSSGGSCSSGSDSRLGRTLSYLLRHGAVKHGFKLRPGGFVYVDELLRGPQCHGYTMSDVKRVVNGDKKGRFTLQGDFATDRLKICANQGHTMEVEAFDLREILGGTDPDMVVIHGTNRAAWDKIRGEGLSRMGRKHIHFAPGEPGGSGVISGMRESCEVMIYLHLQKAIQDGLEFFQSSNEVILCAGNRDGIISPCYFEKVVQCQPCRRVLPFDSTLGSPTDRPATQRANDRLNGSEDTGEEPSRSSGGGREVGRPNIESSDKGGQETLIIRQMSSASTLRVPITIEGQTITAIVDTGAQVTLISDRLYKSLPSQPPIIRKVVMDTAGRDLSMFGFVVGPVHLQLGPIDFHDRVFVAPINDDMLFGLDFIKQLGIVIDAPHGRLRTPKGDIPLCEMGGVAEVTVREELSLPPNTVTRVACAVSHPMPEYMVEPELDLECVMPCTMHQGDSVPVVCLINLGDEELVLLKDQVIARAYPVISVDTPLEPMPEGEGGLVSSGGFNPALRRVDSDENPGLERGLSPDPGSGGAHSHHNSEPLGEEGVEIPGRGGSLSQGGGSVSPGGLSPTGGGGFGGPGMGDVLSEGGETSSPGVPSPLLTGGGRSGSPGEGNHASPGGGSVVPGVPPHLEDLLERSSTNLQPIEVEKLTELLVEFQDVFAKDEFDLGNFTSVEHRIDTGDARPVKDRMRRTPLSFADEEVGLLQKMLKAGVIRPSTSDWVSAPVLVRKRDGKVRWCVDYRKLNDVTIKDQYPLPLIEECIDTLAGNTWFSKLDANQAYWQIKIHEADAKKTAFVTKYGLFEFARMGFGLCNAPATFSRAMNLILRGLTWETVLAFLDDILVSGVDFTLHLGNLREVFLRLRTFQMKLKPKKCELFQIKVDFLGRTVSEKGVELSRDGIKAVADWPVPTSVKEVEQFCGLANYNRMFIQDFARMAAPLYQLTGKKAVFGWGREQQQAFEEIKLALTTPPVLAFPNSTDPFILDTDASDKAIGAVLIQVQGGQERVIAYGSYALTHEQRRYCTTRKELLAVIRFLRQFRHYLQGTEERVLVRTDHNSLTWLVNFKDPQGQLARWLEETSQYNFKVVHRAGKLHGDADAVSRIPQRAPCVEFQPDGNLEELPCGGCEYCVKAHQGWASFRRDVDDVIPLSPRGGGGLGSSGSDRKKKVASKGKVAVGSVSARGTEESHEDQTVPQGAKGSGEDRVLEDMKYIDSWATLVSFIEGIGSAGDRQCISLQVDSGGGTAERSDRSPGWVSPGTEGGDSEGGGVSILTGGAEGSSEDLVLTDMKYIDSGGGGGGGG
jgi:RNA:NAD 2'-phosphotransferase (TPT1/KptA family)